MWPASVQCHTQPVFRPRRHRRVLRFGPIGPLDNTHAIAAEILVKAKGKDLVNVLDSVEVEVVQGYATGIFLEQCESWTIDRRTNLESVSDALREDRLAGAQLTAKQDNVTWLEQST
jgi:hypothetical protein